MKIPKLAIGHYQFTIIVFLFLLAVGMNSFFMMPRTENPTVYIPGGSIVVVYPGASPKTLEQLVAIPIEEAINELDDIKRFNTEIKEGLVIINTEFTYNTDAQKKYDDMVSKVNSIKNDLPKNIREIIINKYTSTDVAIMQLALTSKDAEYRELDRLSENLKHMATKSYGVKKVKIHALPRQEVRISLNTEKMAEMNISISDVENAIKSNNENIPGGSFKLSGQYFSIQTSGSYNNLDEIRNTVVSSYNGRIIYLKNISTTGFDYEDQDYYGYYNGQRCIFISIEQKDGYNIFKIMDGLKPVIQKFKNGLPAHITLETVYDQSNFVRTRINGFMNNLFQGILLVGLLIFLSLGFRPSVIVITAIPLSVIIGLGIVDTVGYGLQQISIAALVVALGLLVDNSIVMVENINRFIQMGYDKRTAAIEAAQQMGPPVFTATLTTLLAFIPIIMMPDKAGDFIRSLPVTIIATLAVSLIIALTLTPLIASKILTGKNSKKEKWLINLLHKFIEGPYRNTLSLAFKNRKLTLIFTIMLLGGSLYVFKFVGISYFPKSETPQFMVSINLPEGSGIEKTANAASYVESVLDTVKQIKSYATNIGHGNPRIYYNIFPKKYSNNYADIYVESKNYDAEKFNNLIMRLRKTFNNYPGAKFNVKEFEQGPPSEAPIVINILGKDVNVLRKISNDIYDYVDASEGTLNVENKLSKIRTDIHFNINKMKAGMLGVPVSEIDKTIRAAVNGLSITKYNDKQGNEYDIVLRRPEGDNIKPADLDKIFITSLAGKQIPLKQLANIEFKKASSIITRYNFQRNAKVIGDLHTNANLDDVMAPVIEKLKNYDFPEGYSYHIAGEIQSRTETFGGMQRAILIAIFSIMSVLVLQFRSFTQPLIIFSAIPLALIGSIWALFFTGYTFSFTAFIGLISLVGIVVNNSIILVDYTNLLLKQGKPMFEALKTSGETRFIPILLTTLTTIGGLLPLTLKGGSLWAPMGWTIIGGLLVSTFLTLIIVPVLYSFLTNK